LKRDVGKQAPTRFDALKLAERRDRVDGEVDATRLPRLADRVVPGEGRIRWSIAGGRDEQDRPALTLGLDGSLAVICQRCLRPLRVPIAQETELLLARNDAELARLDADEQEVVLAAAPLDALTLVEDELLLSLPFAPCHEKGECAAAAPMPAARVAPSPFAPLAGLKTGSRSRN
jgi:uncharacterized protein